MGTEAVRRNSVNKPKRTFWDPQIGEAIESTVLARWGTGLAIGLIIGLIIGLFVGLVAGWATIGKINVQVGLVVGGLLGGILAWRLAQRIGLKDGEWFEAAVSILASVMILAARRQHFRRQRILRRKQLEKEWAGVPDGAISRAQPPSKPEPTQGSLSRVEVLKEDPTRLQKDVEAEKEAEERPKIPIHIERR